MQETTLAQGTGEMTVRYPRMRLYGRLDTDAFVGGYAVLGDDVTLHTGAKVMPGKHVGDHATLGAGSVLLSNLHASATVFGVPALKV